MIKFDTPMQTKSGLDIDTVWADLQKCWAEYKEVETQSNIDDMCSHALKIQHLEEDIGLKKTAFVELN